MRAPGGRPVLHRTGGLSRAIDSPGPGLDRGMQRRMLFPLRRCPGLVPIRELDDDIVLVILDRGPFDGNSTLRGGVLPRDPERARPAEWHV